MDGADFFRRSQFITHSQLGDCNRIVTALCIKACAEKICVPVVVCGIVPLIMPGNTGKRVQPGTAA